MQANPALADQASAQFRYVATAVFRLVLIYSKNAELTIHAASSIVSAV